MPAIRPPHSIVLLVGREDYTAPTTFGGAPCVATQDCVAVATLSPVDGPTLVSVAPTAGDHELVALGTFTIESEGLVSVRDVFHREHDAMGVEPGLVEVQVLTDGAEEPDEVRFVVRPAPVGAGRAGRPLPGVAPQLEKTDPELVRDPRLGAGPVVEGDDQ